jgi:methyl-accepting chemotaxis protein
VSNIAKAREAIAAELELCVEHVVALTADATQLSEREVVAAGRQIATLSHEARASSETLGDLSRQFGSSSVDGRASLEEAVRGQTDALTAFLGSLNEALTLQSQSTSGIVEVARQIGTLVAGIGSLSADMGILTINARIEAARWGSQAAAFDVIASHMRELTGEVQRVNTKVGGLATTITSLANRLVENDKVLHDLGTSLKTDVSARVEELHGAYGSAQRSAAAASEVGTHLTARIAEFSSATLTNLQFQDRMAQTFREIDAFVTRSRDFTTAVLVHIEESGEEADVDEAIAAARERAGSGIVRISHESELTASDRTMQSGVVELF